MLREKDLENIVDLIRASVNKSLDGDFLEAGVWRGGGSIVAKAAIQAYASNNKTVFVCDSFEGLPRPEEKWQADKFDTHYLLADLPVSKEEVQRNFQINGALDDKVKFFKGFFKESMPTVRQHVNKLSVLRLDGDMYSSTFEVLGELYDKVEIGGYVIVDDWKLPGAHAAIHDFMDCFGFPKNFIGVGKADKGFERAGVRWTHFKIYWEKTAEVPQNFRERVYNCPQVYGKKLQYVFYKSYVKRKGQRYQQGHQLSAYDEVAT
ncbi:hypothetical protein CYMTET_57100 [Cymbomonas tetramitiformis]|uniref:Macrocin O-methyltransferase n=1 Tax=Cymbomonas tetramitiformis TaxID=36881 RepID=A0AAE0BAV2_9CHLO|nr:hypothetical protein CYMTET_57100 [Cymbomonas tetramitiformis]